jgi:hypothetical protein
MLMYKLTWIYFISSYLGFTSFRNYILSCSLFTLLSCLKHCAWFDQKNEQ